MPGFLGSERHFNSRYTKPILQSREHKCSSRELEAGALAMESLHRQVLPFILRRLKDDVLDDLPPKIMQDYYCELSPLQSKLYEDFTQGKLCNDVTKKSIDQLSSSDVSVDIRTSSKSHVFQALQYLKNVCNHPKLVLKPKHSQYNQIKKYLESERSTLDDINHSSKLRALKQLLIDCGIGIGEEPQQAPLPQQQAATLELESVVNQHRALIFCQLRSMVDIIENDLFKRHLPNITYLRLDGSVPVNQRQSIVSRFNNDPSIDVLLLTTQIGGLGLNLTGADTVIFVEHDWNPSRDLQAMDRAHRIGQKKVVNVYRLITRDTLEEKIMGLQKFKTMVSSTVINQDNTGLNSMNVEQLLDLFEASGDDNCKPTRVVSGKQSAADLLPELWDQQQYETEYNLDTFVSSLKN
uniref:TATA-binding protein-associated factor 172 n=1 Tax=Aceria tosichella TaxID=561515 RepID=A0A6G1S9Z7_9ACAR